LVFPGIFDNIFAKKSMIRRKVLSFFAGFILLFIIYHFPEFFSSLWIMAVFKIGFLVAAFFVARWQGWKGLGGYGLGLQKKWWQDLLRGLGTGLLFFSLSVCLSNLLGYEKTTGFVPPMAIGKQLPLILLMTVFPSVAEDILTRGYLFGHLSTNMKPAIWIVLSAAVFLLNHLWRLGDGTPILVYLFSLGLVLACAVIRTHALWLAFGIHWGANIAFESSRAFMKSTSLVTHHGSTWLLAGCWLLLLLIMLLMPVRKKDIMTATA
jgi:membrane protease YdiL (CAAX protease family)